MNEIEPDMMSVFRISTPIKANGTAKIWKGQKLKVNLIEVNLIAGWIPPPHPPTPHPHSR